ncbi:MAG: pantoate--beta-alanine ligase [Flavobacterium sp.]|uniref:pantoate--beta-alanine ligase n=1 Tax=Flavobacterium sp. TaxID=239 RepID=UPI001214D2B3|nr:pantoate--beta-alanine ligase [Flavobacterium sp.]RZJ68542.1 MAG: pantoate--beta-alanine ligase [Flavobacterium sp.]
MLIFNNQAGLSAHLDSITDPGATTGFVPTMGALHEGHLSLLRESLAHNDITVISIFVNPTQFNNPEDLAKYPRTLDADTDKIKDVSPDIIVFAPTVDDIYEGTTVSSHFDFDGLENQMEGKFRPGHFDGVGTIVKRLFEIVKPTNAYFGEKDFQQLQIVRKLVSKYKIPVTIVGCEIFREPNGLAMSSRNERLTPELREKAAVIYKALLAAKQRFGTENVSEVVEYVTGVFTSDADFELEYFEIADEETLQSVQNVDNNRKYRAFIAVFANNVRLIDTISLN